MEHHDYVGKGESCEDCGQYPGHDWHKAIPGPSANAADQDPPPDDIPVG